MNKILKRTLSIFASLLFIAGVALVLYQPVSVELGKLEAKSIIEEFDKTYNDVNNKNNKKNHNNKPQSSQASVMNVDVKALKNASIKYKPRLTSASTA